MEQFLDRDFGIPTHLTGQQLRIVGRLDKRKGFRGYPLPHTGNRAPKWRTITFKVVRCDVLAPYAIYWKVKNTGEEARAAVQLRGDLSVDPLLLDQDRRLATLLAFRNSFLP
ncbi:MAG TPA: hypothetical protein VG147_06740 [Solirubrobacteraceae bacterium]|jgi:hypothetical protein|nr:hypothetical protein [Solirubrobacteraceae bacterium]